MTEKQAADVSQVRPLIMNGMFTRNDHSLTAHNEDYLHWTKLLQSELPALPNGVTQLDDEDRAEEADADGYEDVCGI